MPCVSLATQASRSKITLLARPVRTRSKAPIRGPSGVAVAALGSTAPKFRFEDSLTDAARTVQRLANQISNDLGSAAGKRSPHLNL